ncbi:MAG TPA: hypothetical protein VMG38_20275 [Trebonia sp.]|nr:hypothetical protein [Trebonia sp.]
MRANAHLVRRTTYAAALAILATGIASAPALAASTGPATLSPNDGGGFDAFGFSTALSGNGNVAIAGSPGQAGTGAAYIFTKSGTAFTQSAELTATGGMSGDQLGTSVAISSDGKTAVSGAPAASSDDGAAYVFSDASGTWSQVAKLTGAGATEFGTSVAISADASTIVVTAPFTNSDNGAAYVFTKSGSTYKEVQKLTTKGSGGLFGFSASVSSNGTTIALGAPEANSGAGVADVFTKSGTAWSQSAQLTVADLGGSANFGLSVAVSGSGTTLAAGAPGTGTFQGGAFVFTESGGTWTQASQLLPPAPIGDSLDMTGLSISMSSDGSVIGIGAGGFDHSAGAVFVATKTNGTWAITATDTEPSPVSDDELGATNGSTGVAGNGSAIVSGAPDRDGEAGGAFVFPVG